MERTPTGKKEDVYLLTHFRLQILILGISGYVI